MLPAYAAAGEKVQILPLLAVVAAAAALCALDIFAGRPLAQRMARRMKTVNIVLLAALALVAAVVVLAVNWTGPIDMAAGDSITRGAYLSEGAYTLHVEADGPVNVQVQTQTWEDAVMNRKQTAYSGAADGASFNAPADNRSVTFIVTADASVHIDAIRYDGAASGQLRLNYTLLPEAIAGRIQTLRSEGNVVQRTVYIQDAMKLFSRSPVVGLGMGAFENGIYNVQSYHYETKYVHNHYVQSMVDTGIIGLLLWVGTLAASAIAVFRLWRKEREQQAYAMSAALGALLLFLMIHAAVEVIFSSGYFLPFGYGALAVVNLCCGDLLPLTFAKESARRWMARVEGLGLAVFAVLLCMNLWARQPRPAGQLRCGPGGRGSGPLRVGGSQAVLRIQRLGGDRPACRYAGDAGALYGGSGEAELQLRAQVSGGGGFPPGPHGSRASPCWTNTWTTPPPTPTPGRQLPAGDAV